jgi:predicted DNA-binding protein
MKPGRNQRPQIDRSRVVMYTYNVYVGDQFMFRTQLYLTDDQRRGLSALCQATGRSQSDLIREAVDRLIEQFSDEQKEQVLRKAAGMWAGHKDIPDFRALRSQWDRSERAQADID